MWEANLPCVNFLFFRLFFLPLLPPPLCYQGNESHKPWKYCCHAVWGMSPCRGSGCSGHQEGTMESWCWPHSTSLKATRKPLMSPEAEAQDTSGQAMASQAPCQPPEALERPRLCWIEIFLLQLCLSWSMGQRSTPQTRFQSGWLRHLHAPVQSQAGAGVAKFPSWEGGGRFPFHFYNEHPQLAFWRDCESAPVLFFGRGGEEPESMLMSGPSSGNAVL